MAKSQIFARFSLREGATRLIEQRQNAPLKIARTFPCEENGGLEICVMDASPGLLAGDDYHMEWVLEPGAKARIITQGATRVHPAPQLQPPCTPNLDRCSRQTTVARVAEGAQLQLWPASIIPFCGADFCGETRVFLEPDASFSFFECLSAGRIARGEIFQFQRVQIQTLVCDEIGPLFCARNNFTPSKWTTADAFRFGTATQWASLVAFGPCVPQNAAKFGHHILQKHGVWGSASQLPRGGVAISMLGLRAHDLRIAAQQIEEAWNLSVSRETDSHLYNN